MMPFNDVLAGEGGDLLKKIDFVLGVVELAAAFGLLGRVSARAPVAAEVFECCCSPCRAGPAPRVARQRARQRRRRQQVRIIPRLRCSAVFILSAS